MNVIVPRKQVERHKTAEVLGLIVSPMLVILGAQETRPLARWILISAGVGTFIADAYFLNQWKKHRRAVNSQELASR